MDRIGFDGSELAYVATAINRAAAVAPAEAAKVVTKGALNIKTGARRRVSGLAHAPAYPRSIDFDQVRVTARGAQTEVGPNKDKRQGALGNIFEFGTIKNAPIPHIAPEADLEQPRFEKAMEDLAVKALGL